MYLGMEWHDGEVAVHKKLKTDRHANPTTASLTPGIAIRLQQCPLFAIGTMDDQGRPWTTVWGGENGYARPLGGNMVGVKTTVDDKYDPVITNLFKSGEGDPQAISGKPFAALPINLDTRDRVKMAGNCVAGAVAVPTDDEINQRESQIQLVVQVDQSLGNCPKYLNRKEVKPRVPRPQIVYTGDTLTAEANELVAKADLFFVSSIHPAQGMDTNHRGGHPGFTRTATDPEDESKSMIVWPEYSGNRLYQTLGNLHTVPYAGLVFPDFETGDVLYVTGKTRILYGKDANNMIPRSNLAVALTVTEARLVRDGLPFRGTPVEASPYNPRVRPLASEARLDFDGPDTARNSVKILDQTLLTPTISRFKFSMNNPSAYKAGQWVALDFSDELDMGYQHMSDDDPSSLNDDYVRTFTVSSPPPSQENASNDNFEVTARRVGPVTKFMFRQKANSTSEIAMRGFGGDFQIKQDDRGVTPFIAGGVGITPILAFLPELDMRRFKLFWTLHIDDVNLVVDTVQRHPGVAQALEVYLTGVKDQDAAAKTTKPLKDLKVKFDLRRLSKEDLDRPGLSDRWYICVGTGLRKTLLEWLAGKEVLYEDFNF